MRQGRRWAVVVALLGLAWLVTPPDGPPLYDGVGFPDEPYRFVPARADGLQPATSAEIVLKVKDSANAAGMIVNTTERGPQASFFAPVGAFQIPGSAADADIVVRVEPVPPEQPPAGRLESNVYRIALTSIAGPVSVGGPGQQPSIVLRAVEAKEPFPVVHYRSRPDKPWRALATKRVGMDMFTSTAPGEGYYVLAPAPAPGGGSGPSTVLVAMVVLAALLMAGVLVGVRRLNTAQGAAGADAPGSGPEQEP